LVLLKEMAPNIARVALVASPGTTPYAVFLRSVEAATPRLGIELIPALVHITAETERTLSKHRTLASCRIRNAAKPHPRAPAK